MSGESGQADQWLPDTASCLGLCIRPLAPLPAATLAAPPEHRSLAFLVTTPSAHLPPSSEGTNAWGERAGRSMASRYSFFSWPFHQTPLPAATLATLPEHCSLAFLVTIPSANLLPLSEGTKAWGERAGRSMASRYSFLSWPLHQAPLPAATLATLPEHCSLAFLVTIPSAHLPPLSEGTSAWGERAGRSMASRYSTSVSSSVGSYARKNSEFS